MSITNMPITKACRNCGNNFSCKPSHAPKKSYCSKQCTLVDFQSRFKGENNPNFKNKVKVVNCGTCGKSFTSYAASPKYCSRSCLASRPSNLKRLASQASSAGKLGGRKKVAKFCSVCGELVSRNWRKHCDSCFEEYRHLRRAGRIDANQKEIVVALQKVGATVASLANMGNGVPDLVCVFRGIIYLLEVKNPKTKGKLSPSQKKWHAEWQGQVAVVYSIQEALAVVGAKLS